MKRNSILLISTALLVGSSAVFFATSSKAVLQSAKAGIEDYSVTFAAGSKLKANTPMGNELVIEDRYSDDFDLTVNGYLAVTKTQTNAFLGLTTPIQKITAFTVVFENTPDGEHLYDLGFALRQDFSYSDSTRAYVDSLVSGHKYTLSDPGLEFLYCSSSDTFRYFFINDYNSLAKIRSITIEYQCE